MNNNRRIKAFLLDWLIWAYIPAGVVYFFRDLFKKSPALPWIYLACVVIGAGLAWFFGKRHFTIGERVTVDPTLAPGEDEMDESVEVEEKPRWFHTHIGHTGIILAVVTFVLGWQITEINLYYVFTRADNLSNMTDRLVRPYWPVLGDLAEKMIETIFLALMATVLSIPLAAVVSFFAARNIMYPLTSKWGRLLAAFVVAVLGMTLGAKLAILLVSPLEGTNFDVTLVRGLLTPIFWLAGLLLGGWAGLRGMDALTARENPSGAKTASLILAGLFGVGVAYALASVVAAVVWAGSWTIFVRDIPVWPWVALALGAVGGVLWGRRWEPDDEFAIGRLVYNVVRFILNATRSIEPFVWALVFVTWFRLGPFPGMVALLVHSVAALGKLYSEQIESIDQGPVEAVRATGANELQTIVYAVVPQIIPPFISFTIYRWDINVRMSTIIGLVGGGGIGQLLFQYQNLGQWRKTSVAVIMIVTVVMILDNVSARIRERII